jgi:hypothetical protein
MTYGLGEAPARRSRSFMELLHLSLSRAMYVCMHVCMYCIVLYLTIYKAPLTARAFQKRSQCIQPLEKRQVLRREKAEDRPPERMADRTDGGRPFHKEGPKEANDLD